MSTPHPSGSTTPRGRRDSVVTAEKQKFGGMKFGSAFFGWLAATGMAVLLAAVLSAIGVGVGLAADTDAGRAAEQAAEDAAQSPTAAGITGAVILAVILLISYFCGGYVAGRMARFDGAKQGIAVWLWAIVITIILVVVGLVAGSSFDFLGQLRSLTGVSVGQEALTTWGVIALVVAVLLALAGAVLGGIAGMRFHRKVDQYSIDQHSGLQG